MLVNRTTGMSAPGTSVSGLHQLPALPYPSSQAPGLLGESPQPLSLPHPVRRCHRSPPHTRAETPGVLHPGQEDTPSPGCSGV